MIEIFLFYKILSPPIHPWDHWNPNPLPWFMWWGPMVTTHKMIIILIKYNSEASRGHFRPQDKYADSRLGTQNIFWRMW